MSYESMNRLQKRDIDELIGICRGVLADGAVVIEEAQFLLDWMVRHKRLAKEFPYTVLFPRITAMLEDNQLDQDEERELIELLVQVSGEPIPPRKDEHEVDTWESASATPFTEPVKIFHAEREFVVTGRCVCGTRSEVEGQIISLGGSVARQVTNKTDYVIVGTGGSKAWSHSSYGNKIKDALRINANARAAKVSIVSEERWLSSWAEFGD